MHGDGLRGGQRSLAGEYFWKTKNMGKIKKKIVID